jgi:hypothetical protein
LRGSADLGTVEPVLWAVLILLLLVLVAVGVVAAVALPHLRAGSQLLTPEGERLVREAKDRLTNASR